MNVLLLPPSDCVSPGAPGPPGPVSDAGQPDEVFSALLLLLLGTPSPAGEATPAPSEAGASPGPRAEQINQNDESVAPDHPPLIAFVPVSSSPAWAEGMRRVEPQEAPPPAGNAQAPVVAELTAAAEEGSVVPKQRPVQRADPPHASPPATPATASSTPAPAPQGPITPTPASPSASPPSPAPGETVEFRASPAPAATEAVGEESAPGRAAPTPAAPGPEAHGQISADSTKSDEATPPVIARSDSVTVAEPGPAGSPEPPQAKAMAPKASATPVPLAPASPSAGADGPTAPAEATALPQAVAEPVSIDGIADRLVTHVRMAAGDGPGRVEMQLHPQHLGRVSLTVSVEGHEVSLNLTTDNAAAQQLLSSRLPELALALSGAGMSLSQVSVSVDDRGQGQQGSSGRSGRGRSSQTQTTSVGDSVGGWRVPSQHVLDISA